MPTLQHKTVVRAGRTRAVFVHSGPQWPHFPNNAQFLGDSAHKQHQNLIKNVERFSLLQSTVFPLLCSKKHRPDLLRAVLYILFSSGLLFQRFLPQARGSDQIWNPLFPNGKDPSYYIDFALSQTKRVSYAASFSVEYISDADKEFVKGMLAKMNRISVREYQGVDILKSLDIKNGVKVLDPVFLLDRNYWETFMHKGSEKDYILIYDFEGSDLMKRVALYFKRKKGWKIYSINDALPRLYADKNFTKVGPQDFLSLIYNCSMFLSNSFHGTAFAVYFNKPFYVFGLKGISLNSRMESLLRSVDLKDRFITENIDIEKLHLNYDFNKVNLLIEEEKNYSKQFLDSVLKTN